MHVIATAGHVDHGKSTLVRALTGTDPDRFAEEQRRGMTIDLGYAWCTLPSGRRLAFVDVPGHERFLSNMLAGVGPVPAALLVVAADAGWARQTEEHVAALDAFGVRHGVLAVSRSDLADPAAAVAEAGERLAGTSLAGIPAVSVSAATGAGLEDLCRALDALADALPPADPAAPVRLWVDRSFTIRGSGTVVTGTLAAGTIRTGDHLELREGSVAVRAIQALGRPVPEISGTARVALNLRGVEPGMVRRGDTLLTPRAWHRTDVVDVRSSGELPATLMLHVGSASLPVRARRLGADGGTLVRLSLPHPLALRIGDRVVLRDPGSRRLSSAVVLDPAPPPLRRRGAAGRRAADLAGANGEADVAAEVRRRRAVPAGLLRRIGVAAGADCSSVVRTGDWLVDAPVWRAWLAQAERAAGEDGAELRSAGVPAAELARRLGLPHPQLVDALVEASAQLEVRDGRIRRRGTAATLRPDLRAAIETLASALSEHPFAAPELPTLASLGLGRAQLGAAAAAGAILRLPGEVVLLPDAPQRAAAVLRQLQQPFTLSEARQALGTTRRVAVPLLEHLDRLGLTQPVDGGLRRMRPVTPAPPTRDRSALAPEANRS